MNLELSMEQRQIRDEVAKFDKEIAPVASECDWAGSTPIWRNVVARELYGE